MQKIGIVICSMDVETVSIKGKKKTILSVNNVVRVPQF